jgi:hypothetical protein
LKFRVVGGVLCFFGYHKITKNTIRTTKRKQPEAKHGRSINQPKNKGKRSEG